MPGNAPHGGSRIALALAAVSGLLFWLQASAGRQVASKGKSRYSRVVRKRVTWVLIVMGHARGVVFGSIGAVPLSFLCKRDIRKAHACALGRVNA